VESKVILSGKTKTGRGKKSVMEPFFHEHAYVRLRSFGIQKRCRFLLSFGLGLVDVCSQIIPLNSQVE
jgi:hypothetical protein